MTVVGMAVVTYLPRVLPLHVSSKHWPAWLKSCLEYLPVALIGVITVPAMMVTDQVIDLNNPELLAFIPTVIVAYISRNLILSVVTGTVAYILIELTFFL